MIIDCEQGTDEWFASRTGVITASSFNKVITSQGNRTSGKTRKDYCATRAGEIITGIYEKTFQSADMTRGIEMEAEARTFFELQTGFTVDQVGFIKHDEHPQIGCSPDGLIGDDSGFEVKCPKVSTHIEYLRKNKVPTVYYPQVQGSMLVTGRPSWYFVSYYPGLKPLIIKVERDEEYCKLMLDELLLFVDEVNQMVKELTN